MQYLTWYNVLVFALIVVSFLIGYFYGRKGIGSRRAIVKEFDTLINRAKQMLATGDIMSLDQFLHECTEDTPYQPNARLLAQTMLGKNSGKQ